MACGVALVVVYLVAVRTGWGQHLDENALLGRSRNPAVQHATGRLLRGIDVASLALLGGTVVLVALLRARVWLAGAAATLIVGATGTAEVLKRVLPRPELAHPDRLPMPSFPSGHTAVATSLALALVLVVPARWRGVAGVLGAVYAVAVGAATVTAGWHRPSDAIGAFLVAVGWAALLASALLVERPTRRRSDDKKVRVAAALLTVGAAALALVGFGVAGVIAAARDRNFETVPFGASYAASLAAIAAAGTGLVALLLRTLGDLVLDEAPAWLLRPRSPRPPLDSRT